MNDTTPLPTTPIETATELPRRQFSPRPILIGAGAALAVLTLGVGGFAFADTFRGTPADQIVITSSANDDSPTSAPNDDPADDDGLTPVDADYAAVTAAALAAVGGGTVTEVDRGDSPGDPAWKVEIRLENGDEAEVRLDAKLNVIRVDLDNDNEGEEADDSGTDDSGDDSATDDSDEDSDSDESGDDSGSDESGDDSGSDDDD